MTTQAPRHSRNNPTRGRQGAVIFVAGLGVWPGLARPVVERLHAARPDLSVDQFNPLESFKGRSPSVTDMTELLRSHVDRSVAPVTLVAESLATIPVLALSLDPPIRLGAIVVHEPAVGRIAPLAQELLRMALDRLTEAPGPAVGVERFMSHINGNAHRQRHPAAQGYLRHHAPSLATLIPSVVAWDPPELTLAVTTIVTIAETTSTEAWSQAAKALTDQGARLIQAGQGHLLSIDSPARLAAIVAATADAAHSHNMAVMTGHPSVRPATRALDALSA